MTPQFKQANEFWIILAIQSGSLWLRQQSVILSWCFNASCQNHGRWSGTITGFLNFFGFPINHHFTIVPHSSVTISWGVQCSWRSDTLPYPLTLSMGHHSWPGTWLVKERSNFEGVWTLSFSKFTIYKRVQAHVCSPLLWRQNTLNTEHLMFWQIINFLRQEINKNTFVRNYICVTFI
jgi:hypothetical protein